MADGYLGAYDEEMVKYIAKRLPNVETIDYMDPFYRDLMKWCMKNYELMQWIAKENPLEEEGYHRVLKHFHNIGNVEAFGILLALRLKEYQTE